MKSQAGGESRKMEKNENKYNWSDIPLVNIKHINEKDG